MMFSSTATPEETTPTGAVVELSSASLRAGLSGEAGPQAEIPLAIGFPKTALDISHFSIRQSGIFPLNPLEQQQDVDLIHPVSYNPITLKYEIQDKDALALSLEFLLGSEGSRCFSTHPLLQIPLLIPEPALTDSSFRDTLAEILFEQLSSVGLYFCKQPSLSTFACGRTSSIVLDSGHSRTTASVTVEGYTLPKSVVETPIGGAYLSKCIFQKIQASGGRGISKDGRPLHLAPVFSYDAEISQSIQKPFVTDSYWNWGIQTVVENIKIKRCECSYGTSRIQQRYYSLPDGSAIDTKSFATSVPEVLFAGVQEDLTTSVMQDVDCDKTSEEIPHKIKFDGCLPLIQESVNLSELLMATKGRDALDTLILSGGNICFPNFIERFREEVITQQDPDTFWKQSPVKLLYTPTASLRRHTTLIGGSILTSLGSFQSFVINKAEYEDSGTVIFQKRCP